MRYAQGKLRAGVARGAQRSFAALRMTAWRSAGQPGAQVDSLARRTQRSFATLRMPTAGSAQHAGAQRDRPVYEQGRLTLSRTGMRSGMTDRRSAGQAGARDAESLRCAQDDNRASRMTTGRSG